MVKIIGHRGAPALAPENTIESFRKAIEAGADYLECDVHMSLDGRLVVIHDDRLDRTTNGTGRVHNFTLAELKALTIKDNLKIPTIEEVLELDFPLMIELKSYRDGDSNRTYEGLVPSLLRLLSEASPRRDVVLLFTNAEYSDQLGQVPFKKLNLLPGFAGFDSVDSSGLFAIGVFYRDLTADLVNEAHERNLKVFSWPPDEEADIKRAILLGLDLLLSNNPGHTIEVARELGQRQ